MAINIQNALEVLPGNIIRVPGCEPTSAFTSPTLAANQDCNASTISLAAALEAIPDAKVIKWPMSGGAYVKRFFVLPEGPPSRAGCKDPSDVPACRVDYYQILRDNADGLAVDNTSSSSTMTVDQVCELFSLRFCGSDGVF